MDPAPRVHAPSTASSATPVVADADYVAGVHRGDEAAFTALVRAYLDPLTRFAYSYVADADVAHDLVQDVFARVWELGSEWAPTAGAAAYLFGAVRHRARNALRNARTRQRIEETIRSQLGAVSRPDANGVYTDVILTGLVRREFQALTERQQDALRLRYGMGQPVARVAALLGIDTRATERLIARALATLRARLALAAPDSG